MVEVATAIALRSAASLRFDAIGFATARFRLFALDLDGHGSCKLRRRVRHGVRRQPVAAGYLLDATTAATPAATAATSITLAIVGSDCGRRRLRLASEDRLVVVVLGLEELRSVRSHLGALTFRLVEHRHVVGLGFGDRLDGFGGFLGLELFDVGGLLRGQALERRCAICQAFFDGRRIPLAQREHPRLDANERVFLVALLHERGKTSAHRHLGTLPDMTEQVPLDGYVSDLFVM
jgi:hypothetical protein